MNKAINGNNKIITELKDFQIKTVNWMIENENKHDGGMVLNEAGTGKTLTCLSLMVQHEKLTLIVCPAGLIHNWITEIKKHTSINLNKVVVYHNQQRYKIHIQKDQKIIITSYTTLANDYKKDDNSLLFNTKFGRVILDEGHYIRNKNNIFKAVENLQSEKKWIVTATPIFNSINDLYAYFKFLELGGIDSKKEWNKLVKSDKKIVKLQELNKIISQHSIRILKKDVLNLPQKNIEKIQVETTGFERKFYDALNEYSINRVNKMVHMIKNLKNMKDIDSKTIEKVMCNNIMVYILRLKQCCDSPWLVINKMKRLQNVESIKNATEMLNYYNKSINTEEECPICLDKTANFIIQPCGHKYCEECINKITEHNIKKCPKCRTYISDYTECISSTTNKSISQLTNNNNDNEYSEKIKYILKLVNDKINKNEKVVIVSQWVTMLNMIKNIIRKNNNCNSVELKGDIPIEKRMENINTFQKDKNCKICYVSLMSSAEGINLTAANNIILLDSWWNESKMSQVMDRLHRIGQQKEVNVYKIIIKNSIEEKIQELLKYKSKLANLIVDKWSIDTKNYNEDWITKIIKLIEN